MRHRRLRRLGRAYRRGRIRRRGEHRSGVVVHELREPSDQGLTVMTSIISLSPGTMTVDVTADAALLHVHFFDLGDVDAARRGLVRLERLVTAAFPRRQEPELRV